MNIESNELEIDLSEETFNFSELQNLNEITTIRFRNYSEKIEIPLSINDYPTITELIFSAKSNKDFYETPDNLEKCIHIKKLTLWYFCNLTKMKPIPHLEELYVLVNNTETDTKNIVALFPNLKILTIRAVDLKNQKLPDEIGNLSSLESLDLANCGLSDLPDAILNLKELKKLRLSGHSLDAFPEQITKLENLEVLIFNHKITKLPDSLIHLKKLKKLNLLRALNGGTTNSTSILKPEKIYLKPIPEVIGKLENLEELHLGTCGVFDVSPLFSLKKLKKLNLQDSALKDCEGFSNFPMLEDLNLESSSDINNLDGLKGLPLKKLNISSICGVKSIDVISSLQVLETFYIKLCSGIKEHAPLYKHPTIKEIWTSNVILEKWKNRENYKELPKLDIIISQLTTDNLIQFEEAILNLSQQVEENYSEDDNTLAYYFDIEADYEEINEIEILDTAIQKHLKNISEKTLIAIFEMTLKSVEYDNYNAALIVLNEITSRKNTTTQEQIIDTFYKACKYYDAGNRLWSSTVQDQLIDNFFPQFTSEALYQLLEKASTSMLNRKGGDAMDALFVPAFQNTTDKQLLEKLLDILFKYQEKSENYFGENYFDELLQKIIDVASPELKNLISIRKEQNKEE